SGALVGIGVVLAAVFVPMGFMGGATGIIYRQFTGTIVVAMGLSVMIALILTPALCATLLKPIKKGEEHAHMGGPIGKFFDWFNRVFNAGSARYQRGVSGILGRPKRFMLIYAALVALMAVLFLRLPTSFLPDEDQGVLMAMVQAPVGATQDRTLQSIYKLEDYFLDKETKDVESVFSVQGFSFAGSGQNSGMAFVKLKDWDQRKTPDSQVSAIVGRAMGALSQIKDAMVYAFSPPPMPELGISTGFTFFLQDNGGHGHDALMAARNQLLGAAAQSKLLTQVRPNGQDDTPQLRVVVDPVKAQTLGVPVATINNTLAVAWGGAYVDDFIDRGRVKRVYMQADAPFRMDPKDFERWSVRGANGQMVPVSSFATWHWEYGSPRLERYNGVAAVEIQGSGAEGVSSGDAMDEIEKLVSQLPPGYSAAWTAMSYQERQAGNQSTMLYILSLLIVFLALAALYESWNVPTAVLMVAPLGILGAVLAAMLRGYDLDVYFQVGMLTTVGLTSKNAVLIIEFAKQNYEQYGMKLI
ncbi:MAG: efflux RND transporter permease subunit, partial [Xanthomonadaceae bacterium]|nr:efflux RND transporter permease subunit [Xanthomonadaceae bacterium]